MFVFAVIVVRIFPHLYRIQTRITLNTDIFYAVQLVKLNLITSAGQLQINIVRSF